MGSKEKKFPFQFWDLLVGVLLDPSSLAQLLWTVAKAGSDSNPFLKSHTAWHLPVHLYSHAHENRL